MISRDQAEARLAKGDKIHMQYADSVRQWWFDSPYAEVDDADMQALQRAGRVRGAESHSQTWEAFEVQPVPRGIL